MAETFSGIRIALVGRDPLLEDEFFRTLGELGVDGGSILSFDEAAGKITLDIDDDEEARVYLPLDATGFSGIDAVFLVGRAAVSAPKELEGLKGSARVLAVSESRAEDRIVGDALRLLMPLSPASFSWTLYQPASLKGKEGIKELFDQTVELLNFKRPGEGERSEQLAFSLLPSAPAITGETEEAIRRASRFEGPLVRSSMRVPIFHGTYVSFLAGFGDGSRELEKKAAALFGEDGRFSVKDDIGKVSRPENDISPSVFLKEAPGNSLWGFIAYDTFKVAVYEALREMSGLFRGK